MERTERLHVQQTPGVGIDGVRASRYSNRRIVHVWLPKPLREPPDAFRAKAWVGAAVMLGYCWMNQLMERYPENTQISIEDFRRSSWRAAVEAPKKYGPYFSLWQSFSDLAQQAVAGGDSAAGKVLCFSLMPVR